MSSRREYRSPTPPARNAGFTLVELVMVIVVAVVAMYPLVALYVGATRDSIQPELGTQAVFLAQERIEEILGDFHAPARGFDYVVDANYPDEATIARFPGFSRSVTVSADSTYDGVTFKQVSVAVSHPAIGAVSLDTWVTN